MSWVEPRDVRDWLRRVFALRPILLTLLISSIIILEMRFDWIERSIGAYLVTVDEENPDVELLRIARRWGGVVQRAMPPHTGRRWKQELETTMSPTTVV